MSFIDKLKEKTSEVTERLRTFVLDLKDEKRYISPENLVGEKNKFFLPYDLIVDYLDLSSELKEVITSWEILLNRYMPKYTKTLAESYYLDLLRLHGTINKYLLSLRYERDDGNISWFFYREPDEVMTDFDLANQCRKTLETLTNETFPIEGSSETIKILVDSSDDSIKFLRKNDTKNIKINGGDDPLKVEKYHVNMPKGRALAESNDVYQFPAVIRDGTAIQGLSNLKLKKYIDLMDEQNPYTEDTNPPGAFEEFVELKGELLEYVKESVKDTEDEATLTTKTIEGIEKEGSPDYAVYETTKRMRAIYPALRKILANYYFNFSRSNPRLFISYPMFLLSTNKLIEATAGGEIKAKVFRFPPSGWIHFTRLFGCAAEIKAYINLYGKVKDTGYRGDKIAFIGHTNCVACHGLNVEKEGPVKMKDKRMKGLFERKTIKEKLLDKAYKGVRGEKWEWGIPGKETKMAERLWLTLLPDEERTQTLSTPYAIWASRGAKFGLGNDVKDVFNELFGEFKNEIIKKAEKRRKRRRPYGGKYVRRRSRRKEPAPKKTGKKKKTTSTSGGTKSSKADLSWRFKYGPAEAARKLRANGLTYFQIKDILLDLYRKAYSRSSVKRWTDDIEKGEAVEEH